MGRNKKSDEDHDLEGTGREDRKAPDSVASIFTNGEPNKPVWLNEVQEKVWDTVVKNIPEEYLGEIDTVSLQSLVMTYYRWIEVERTVDQLLGEFIDANGELDSNYMNDRYKLAGISTMLWKRLQGLLDRFGMSPAARQKITKITTGKPEKESQDLMSSFLETTRMGSRN